MQSRDLSSFEGFLTAWEDSDGGVGSPGAGNSAGAKLGDSLQIISNTLVDSNNEESTDEEQLNAEPKLAKFSIGNEELTSRLDGGYVQ